MRADPYTELLYEWERIVIESKMKPAVMASWEIRELVHAASSHLDVPPPSIQFISLPLPCMADSKRNTIRIAEWGRTPLTVLHEMAHLLAAAKYGAGGHGRVFLTLAIDLYGTFLGVSTDALEASALEYGLEFIPRRLVQATRPKDKGFYDEEF